MTAPPDRLPHADAAPQPALTLRAHTAVITGVRFIWPDRCIECHHQIRLATDDGTITAGIHLDHRRGPHWYQRWHPAGPPLPPPRCPACHRPAPFAAHRRRDVDPETHRRGDAYPVHSCQQLLRRTWDHIRATYPQLAAQADAADRMRR